MMLQVADFRFHSEWGVGKIRAVTSGTRPDVTIDFEKRPDHSASATWVERETSPVAADSLRALAYENYEYAQTILREDPVKAFILTLKDFPNQRAKNESLKEYIGRYVDWETWWKQSQPLLKAAPQIDTSHSKQREYGLRLDELSQAEEAYDRFRRLQTEGNRVGAEDQARHVLNLIDKGQPIAAEEQEQLRAYFLQFRADQSKTLSARLDVLFRLVKIGWVSKSDGLAEVHACLHEDLRLYDLTLFTQTRLLDMLFASVPDGLESSMIASGICADEDTATRVVNWLISRGDKNELETALRLALTEKLPATLDELRSFRRRFSDCLRLTSHLPTRVVDWRLVATWLGRSVGHIAHTTRPDQLDEFDFGLLLRLAQEFWTRAGQVSNAAAGDVMVALADADYPRPFLEDLLVAAQSDKQLLPDVVNALTEQLIAVADERQPTLIAAILGRSNLSPEQQIHRYVGQASRSIHKQVAQDWLAEHVVASAQGLIDDLLVPVLNDLNTLSKLGYGRPWRERLDAQRERGYRHLISQSSATRGGLSGPDDGNLDAAVLGALRAVLTDRTSHLQHELESLQQQLVQSQADLADARSRVAHGETVLGEVSRERQGRADALRFEERFRLMQEFANSVAEIERYAVRQGNPSAEVQALLVRINSILRSNKVEVTARIGELINFDAAFCQTVSGTPLQPGEQVRVAETGYRIRDHIGTMRLLKPALVVRIEGG